MAQNFLSPKSFRFSIKRAPSIEYYVQAINMPSISSNFSLLVTPLSDQKFSADKLEFSELTLTFRIDENMANYIEIFDWMIGMTTPTNFSEASSLRGAAPGETAKVYSDATLYILNSTGNPEVEVKFEDIFPTALTDISLDLRATDIEYAECSASFAYKRFSIANV